VPSELARLVKRSPALTCAYYLFDDWRARRRLARGIVETRSGSRHARLELSQSLAYIERVAEDYLVYAGRERFAGRVAEIGPGDSQGVALVMLARGAAEVHTVDRYRSQRDPATEAAIQRALAERQGHRFDGRAEPFRVTEHSGAPAETFFRATPMTFDWIVSRAVLEHLYDPIGALDAMFASLNPGGVMVHRVDLRDHGMFAGHHPLTFLTVPERLYRAMTRGAGRPNRVLAPAYRAWLARVPGSARITRLAGEADEFAPAPWDALDAAARERACATVRAIRDRLARPLRGLADEDLAISGIVLVAHKP
jgi:SAM-dependent methyltransferase